MYRASKRVKAMGHGFGVQGLGFRLEHLLCDRRCHVLRYQE